ncbi:MAG TPA: hypothetical protein P5267_01760 [Patescibacteria group bacterium]|nr:hypothetical protein [Patescibacteria group bacterium]
MFLRQVITLFGSQLFANIILLITVLVAFAIGYRQIALNDVVEIYATPSVRQTLNIDNGSKLSNPIINIQNVGTRLVYLDKYIFNGTEYITHGQILPSGSSQAGASYWIDLPTNGTDHVSLLLFYHDLDGRKWKSEILADFINNIWKVSSLPHIPQ